MFSSVNFLLTVVTNTRTSQFLLSISHLAGQPKFMTNKETADYSQLLLCN